jgi:hypothetical protein
MPGVRFEKDTAWPDWSLHAPQIGDTGTIIGIFPQMREPHTVESLLTDSKARWLADFLSEDLEEV